MGRRAVMLEFRGKRASVDEISRETRIPSSTLRAWIRRGKTPEEVVQERRQKGPGAPAVLYPFEGRMMKLSEISNETGINTDTLRSRIKRGCTPEQAVSGGTTEPRDAAPKEYMFRGVVMTIRQMADTTGIPPDTIRKRIRKGWEIERAATEPIDERRLKGNATVVKVKPEAAEAKPATRVELAAMVMRKLIPEAREGDMTHDGNTRRFELKSEFLTYAVEFRGELAVLSATYNASGMQSDLCRAWRVKRYGLGEAYIGNARGEWERVY